MSNNIISEISVLIEDINLLIGRINGSDRTNNSLPLDVYRRSVSEGLNTLENEYGIELEGFNSDYLKYGVEDYHKADREEVDESVEAIEERAKEIRKMFRNGMIELPDKVKSSIKL